MADSRRSFLSALAMTGMAPAIAAPAAVARASQGGGDEGGLSVTRFGAVGDGETPCADAFQAAIDAAEAAGGGLVSVPAGTFILERTPLIASRVHLRGAGAATILRGTRPGSARGSALVSNKGQQQEGYTGAHDWSISHLTIDSPHTNGIVVTHARNVYIGHIYGIDTYDHFVDTAGLNILCENLFLTGRSGASAFQVDSLSGAQTIWDGREAVPPLYDGTQTHQLILRSSIITASAGHTGTNEWHDVSVHFHGDDARGFLFSDLILGGAAVGFYQDADTRYQDISISNVLSTNSGHAAWFGPGKTGQRGLSIRGLKHAPAAGAAPRGEPAFPQRSIYLSGREDAQLMELHLVHDQARPTDYAIRVEASESVILSQSILEGHGGAGFVSGENVPAQPLISGCVFKRFETGILSMSPLDERSLIEQLNSFVGTREKIRIAR